MLAALQTRNPDRIFGVVFLAMAVSTKQVALGDLGHDDFAGDAITYHYGYFCHLSGRISMMKVEACRVVLRASFAGLACFQLLVPRPPSIPCALIPLALASGSAYWVT